MRKATFISFIFFLLFLSISTKVSANALSTQTADVSVEKVAAQYFIRSSNNYTSEGEAITSYDISDKGLIAIAFTNNTIGVFDQDMKFLYEISFDTSGSYGVLWNEERVEFLDCRSNTAIEFNEEGEPIAAFNVVGPQNYWYEMVLQTVREKGKDTYFCRNEENGDSSFRYAYYTILEKVNEDGEKTILYKSQNKVNGQTYGIIIIAAFFLLVLLFLLIVVVRIKRFSHSLSSQSIEK